nr:MAG TPA: hypothetical protein [Caudoviricetes sp.]
MTSYFLGLTLRDFECKSPQRSRFLSLMTLFGNDYDYKKRLLFTATHIEQV